MIQELLKKEKTLAVIGLGYVGLPIALEFAKKMKVVGFDINEGRVEQMKNSIDPSGELESSDFDNSDIHFTHKIEDLKEVSFYIVAVPTPIDQSKMPDLRPLLGASNTVGQVLSKGDYVVFESTVYPGCTEEDCVPVLESLSGLKFIEDFKVGFSPERINPGDKEHTLTKIVKVSSGCDNESAENIAQVYESIITAGVHRASSLKVAEAAKIIENTQRDVNIALMNELSIICNKLDINTFEVLEAAGSKWNFLNFRPGLVGGHCIGVDPYYLTYKAQKLGHYPKVILSGREINDNMGSYVARQAIDGIIEQDVSLKAARVLVMGATFKENVEDIRNSKVVDVINELKSFRINVDVIDPQASSEELNEEYGFGLVPEPTGRYNAIVFAVNHNEYVEFDESYFQGITEPEALFVDVKGTYKGRFNKLKYWSL